MRKSVISDLGPSLAGAVFSKRLRKMHLRSPNSSPPRVCCALSLSSHVWLFATLWTVAHQTPLSMGFSRQKYWSGLPCPPPGALPHPGIKRIFFTFPTLGRGPLPLSATWLTPIYKDHYKEILELWAGVEMRNYPTPVPYFKWRNGGWEV